MPGRPDPTQDDINLRGAWRTLRRSFPLILAVAVVAGGGAYLYTKGKAPEYQASATILSAGNPTTNTNLNQTLISPPALPQDAVRDALNGPTVLKSIRDSLPSIGVSGNDLTDLRTQLNRDMSGNPKTFSLKGLPDAFGNALYTLTVRDTRPEVAAGLANLAASALVTWDTNRGINMARASIRAVQSQLSDLNDPAFTRTLDPRAVADSRSRLTAQLTNLTALERAAVGSLSVLRAAVPPDQPVTASPTKNAILAAVIAAFLAAAASFLIGTGSRSVEGGNDLRALDLRVLAEVPHLDARGKGPLGVLAGLTRGTAAEALALARFNALNVLGKDRERVLLITSPVAAEGK
ncbi:MAG TPA: Wzz/FepE/Etk N-terminal domain-containing protein, partial [Deinococcales bacterium]|nr:Wzz/FepE/Etk N-terminal domain-containing protein [Deinococcales bacterium]